MTIYSIYHFDSMNSYLNLKFSCANLYINTRKFGIARAYICITIKANAPYQQIIEQTFTHIVTLYKCNSILVLSHFISFALHLYITLTRRSHMLNFSLEKFRKRLSICIARRDFALSVGGIVAWVCLCVCVGATTRT